MRLNDWPDCTTKWCENKQCLWSGTSLCYPHAEQLLGESELNARYLESHKKRKKRNEASDHVRG